MAKTAKDKTATKKFQRGSPHATDELKTQALAFYFITGSIKVAATKFKRNEKTLYQWIKESPEIVKKAKNIANDRLDAKCTEIVDLAHRGIIEKIDTKAKRAKASLKELNFVLGTSLDKLMDIRGLKKTKVVGDPDEPMHHTFTFGAANLKPQKEKTDDKNV